VHVRKEKRKAVDDRSEECVLIGSGSGNVHRLLTKETRKLIIVRDVKFDESLLGFGYFRNKVEPLYIYDDDEDKKGAQALIEDVKEPTSEKPAFKIAKKSATSAETVSSSESKGRCQERRRGKERSSEDDSVLTDIETYSDSESPEESGEASQGILNSIGGLFSRFSGAAANITVSTSSMVLEEMVYGVSHETEPTSFQHAISRPESKKWIEAIQSEVSSLEENQTWEICCLPPGRKAIPIKWVLKKKTDAEGKVCRYKASLVCKGFLQREGIDFVETCVPVAKF
jgi:hypothetical protein